VALIKGFGLLDFFLSSNSSKGLGRLVLPFLQLA